MMQQQYHYGYVLRYDSGHVKVGITKDPIARFKAYKTHNPRGTSVIYMEKFPSKTVAEGWEKLVMHYASSNSETFAPSGPLWMEFLRSGSGVFFDLDINSIPSSPIWQSFYDAAHEDAGGGVIAIVERSDAPTYFAPKTRQKKFRAARHKEKDTTFTFRISSRELDEIQDILDAQPRKKRQTVAGICRGAIAEIIEQAKLTQIQ